MPPVDLAAGEHRAHGRHKDHTEHHRHHGEHRHGVLEELIGPEHPVGPRDRLLGMEAVLAKQGQMHDEKQHERGRQEPGMDREEAGQRVVAVVGAAHDKLLDRRTHKRHKAGQVRGHPRGPVALLVPGEQIARERHPQDEHHEHKSHPEINFPGRPVGPVDHHLQKMEREQHHHRVGHEMVNAAEEPAAGHFVLDVPDALPGGLGAGGVARPQEEPRDQLRHEGEHERAAPHVPPAGSARHPLEERLADESPPTGAAVEEVAEPRDRPWPPRLCRCAHATRVLHGRATFPAMPV